MRTEAASSAAAQLVKAAVAYVSVILPTQTVCYAGESGISQK